MNFTQYKNVWEGKLVTGFSYPDIATAKQKYMKAKQPTLFLVGQRTKRKQ